MSTLALRVRTFVAVARPPVLALLTMYAATGYAVAGGDPSNVLDVVPALAAVAGYLVFSVSVNDLADVEVDRVNLAGRRDRPLASGSARERELIALAAVGGLLAMGAAGTMGWAALAVTAAGLVISAAYSLPPIRISGRGAIASLLLPACYVAVPYLLGAFSTSSSVTGRNLLLLAGLYIGFIGRILLKDFRDVRGDALFGKRTFLVRHGRVATCWFAATGWTTGTALTLTAMALAGNASVALYVGYGLALVGVLAMLRALAKDRGVRRDERLISAIAIVGRSQILGVLVALSMVHRPAMLVSGAIALITAVCGAQAIEMVRRGPAVRNRVPDDWAAELGLDAELEVQSLRSLPTANV